MSDTVMGSVARPVRLDPFQRIVGVQWAVGGIGVLEVISVPDFIRVGVEDPLDVFFTGVPFGDQITPDIYENDFALKPDIFADKGLWRAENEIHPIIVDYAQIYDRFGDEWEEGKQRFIDTIGGPLGYGPTLDLVGAVAVFQKTIEVHPSGRHVEYVSGYAPTADWWVYADHYGKPPALDGQDPDGLAIVPGTVTWFNRLILDTNRMVNWAERENGELIWHRVTTRPAVDLQLIKQIWLFNFLPEKVQTGRVSGFQGGPIDYTLKIYNTGTFFDIDASGEVTATRADHQPVAPKYSAAGSGPDQRLFTASGFVT